MSNSTYSIDEEDDGRVFNTIVGEEPIDIDTGDMVVTTTNIDKVSQKTIDCSIPENSNLYEQCKGNQGSIQKIQKGDDLAYIIICCILIVLIIILVALQYRKWIQTKKLNEFNERVSKQAEKDFERYNELKRLEEKTLQIVIVQNQGNNLQDSDKNL